MLQLCCICKLYRRCLTIHPDLQDAKFGKLPGVLSTRVGYTGGDSPKPTYDSVCSGDGHTEAVKVELDSKELPYEGLLKVCHLGSCSSQTNQLILLLQIVLRVVNNMSEVTTQHRGSTQNVTCITMSAVDP